MNIMIQLIVPDNIRALLLELKEWMGRECTLTPSQSCHHVTLAFKPTEDEVIKWANMGDVKFEASTVYGNDRIAALFGTLWDPVGCQQIALGGAHITLAGTIPPVNSKYLEEDCFLFDFKSNRPKDIPYHGSDPYSFTARPTFIKLGG